MRTKEEVARDLVLGHQQQDPETRRAYRFDSDDDPDEPIKLIEVTNSTFATGSAAAFDFPPTEAVPYPVSIAVVTEDEWQQVAGSGGISPPDGFDLRQVSEFRGRTFEPVRIEIHPLVGDTEDEAGGR
jgi:hypothetical protein